MWRPTLLLLFAPLGFAQELRVTILVDPGDIARPPVCPVQMRLESPDLPEEEMAWVGRVDGAGASRIVQVRTAPGGGALDLVWLDDHLEPGRVVERELVLQPRARSSSAEAFRMEDADGARELRSRDDVLWSHQLAWDPARHDETFRPYTHLFGWRGEVLTKGPGGLYPHHRGVFCGWTRVRAGDVRHNFWSIPKAPRPHQEHVGWDDQAEWLGPLLARVAARTDWVTADGAVLVEEHRAWDTLRYDAGPDAQQVLLDYTVTLTARGDAPVTLNGDPAHAGFQVRLAQSVAAAKACTYVLPDSATGGKGDNWSDAPWVAGRFPMGERRYELLFLDHPTNPRPTVFNTRDYGRFGPFFRTTLTPGEPLLLRYALRLRELVEARPDPEVHDLELEHRAWVTPVEARVAR